MAEEIIYNIKDVTSFCNFHFEINRFNNYVDQSSKYNRQKAFKSGFFIGLMMLLIFLSFVITIFYGRYLIKKNKTNTCKKRKYKPGDIITVITSTLSAILSINNLTPYYKIFSDCKIACLDYLKLRENNLKSCNKKTNELIPNRDNFKGKIEFKNVGFKYKNDSYKETVLKNLNFVIEPGMKIGIIGESGTGKSTVINLIQKIYEPDNGEILINDINIKNYNIKELRNLMGYATQETMIFNKSIKDNIYFGRYENIKKNFGNP